MTYRSKCKKSTKKNQNKGIGLILSKTTRCIVLLKPDNAAWIIFIKFCLVYNRHSWMKKQIWGDTSPIRSSIIIKRIIWLSSDQVCSIWMKGLANSRMQQHSSARIHTLRFRVRKLAGFSRFGGNFDQSWLQLFKNELEWTRMKQLG